MKLKHIDENSSMHPDDIYKSVRATLDKAKANRKPPGELDPNANYAPTGDAASAEEKRARGQYHRDQDERERQRGHGRLEEEPDALAGRRKSDPAPHPYRKHGTPLNRPPSDPNYPDKPFNKDDWMASSKKMEEEDSLGNNWRTRKPEQQKTGSNPNYPQKPFNRDEWMKSSKPMSEEEQLNELTNELLGKYKKAAALDAGKADDRAFSPDANPAQAKADIARGNKRFKGINTATKKQFANDRKPKTEGMMGGINRSAPATDVSYEKVLDDSVMQDVQAAYGAEQRPAQTQGPIGFLLIDPKEGSKIIGKYQGAASRGRANGRRDKLDNAHGSYRYRVVPVYAGTPEEKILAVKEEGLEENKHRARTAATQAGQPNFTDILNKQHQDTTAQQPAKAVSIPFHGWEIKYKPNGKGQVDWVVIKKDKILQKGIANSDKEAVGAAEEWIKKGAGEKKDISKNATIDFNSKFVSTFAPGGETFYSTFVSQGGQPFLVISQEPHEGLTRSSIRAGSNFPSIHVGPRVARPVGLQPHGRYIVDVDNKQDLDDPGVAMYPLVFQGIIHDKTEREHMKGPGFTVAYSRDSELDEQIDRWKSYVPTDPTTGQPSVKMQNIQKRAPKNAKMGSAEVPFSELICDTIRKHGIRWAFQYYVLKGGVPPAQFKILAKDALENRE